MNRLQLALDVLAGKRPPVPAASPLQQPTLLLYPELEARPFWATDRFPWAARLEDEFPRIRGELEALLRERRGFRTVWKQTTAEGHWAAMWLYLYGKPQADNT